jgi:hypothetical protein
MSIERKDIQKLINFVKLCPPTEVRESVDKDHKNSVSVKGERFLTMIRLYYGEEYILIHFTGRPFARYESEDDLVKFLLSIDQYLEFDNISGTIMFNGLV